MSKETRGSSGRIIVRSNEPKLKLTEVLRRRKTNLTAFVNELGITTYAALDIWCGRLGISAPTEEQFNAVMPRDPSVLVNSAQEGVVVLEPIVVIDDISGRKIDPTVPVEQPGVYVVTDSQVPTDDPVKKQKKSKTETPTVT